MGAAGIKPERTERRDERKWREKGVAGEKKRMSKQEWRKMIYC